MAKKRKPAPKAEASQPGSAPADFGRILDRAFKRNGDNSILLNIQQGLDALVSEVKHISKEQGRLAIEQARTAEKVEHIADEQHTAVESRREMHRKLDGVAQSCAETSETCAVLKTTVDHIAPKVLVLDVERTEKAGQRKLITKGRVVIAGLVTVAGAAWHQFENIRAILHGKPIPHP
jgi:hypothetical protein